MWEVRLIPHYNSHVAFVNNWRTFEFIEFMRLKPILYNTRLKDFRNKNMKENAWRKTAEEMNSTCEYFTLIIRYASSFIH